MKNEPSEIKSNNINDAIVNCLIWNLYEPLQTHKINISNTRERKEAAQKRLRGNPSGNWVISIFSGQKPCTRII